MRNQVVQSIRVGLCEGQDWDGFERAAIEGATGLLSASRVPKQSWMGEAAWNALSMKWAAAELYACRQEGRGEEQELEDFRRARNLAQSACRQAKRQYQHRLVRDMDRAYDCGDLRQAWTLAGRVSGVKLAQHRPTGLRKYCPEEEWESWRTHLCEPYPAGVGYMSDTDVSEAQRLICVENS